MNLQNFVDVGALKAKMAQMNKEQHDLVESHPEGKKLPFDHPHRHVDHARIRVLVAEAVNAASKEIISAAKDEVFNLVHED